MRGRFYLFAAIVLLALAAHLALLTSRVSQVAEDAMRSRLATASAGLRSQIALLDASLPVRAAAQNPELIEASKSAPDNMQPVKPDERALRAAFAGLQPEPDLVIIGSPAGTAVTRHSKGSSMGDDAAARELVRGAVEGPSAARFAIYEGRLYRIVSARIAGTESGLVAGQAIDDRFASQLRTQVDADVTFLADQKVLASSLPAGTRAEAGNWAKSPSAGFGTLTVRLPLAGTALSGKLPMGTSRVATRAALAPLPDSSAQAVVSVPAGPYLSWLGRYQAFYLAALVLFLLGAIVWGRFLAPKAAVARTGPAPRLHPSPPVPSARPDAAARSRVLVGADVSAPSETVKPLPAPTELPWAAGGEEDGIVSGPTPRRKIDTPIFDPFPEPRAAAAETAEQSAAVEPAVGPLSSGPEGGWTVGEARDLGADPGPASFGEELVPGEPIAARDEAQRESEIAANLSASNEAVPLPGAGPQKGDHLLASPDSGAYQGDEPTRVEPLSATLIEQMRERDAGEAPLEQRAPDRLGTGWENPALAGATPEPAWGGAAEAGAEEPAPAPWNEPVSTLPEGAPTPPWNEPVSAEEAGSDAAPGEAASLETEVPLQTPIEGVPVAADEAQGELPPLQEIAAEGEGGAAAEMEGEGAGEQPMEGEGAAEQGLEGELPPGQEMEAAAEGDAEEAHFYEIFERFLELRRETGEPDNVSYDKFVAKLRRNREELMERHQARSVRFTVYLKDGRAAIKGSALR